MAIKRSNWVGGLAEWTEGETAFLSIAFTWKLNDAYQRAAWYRSAGYKVKAGGPGIFTRKHFLADIAEIGGDYPDAVWRHNPAATIMNGSTSTTTAMNAGSLDKERLSVRRVTIRQSKSLLFAFGIDDRLNAPSTRDLKMPKGGANKGRGRGVQWIRAHLDYDGPECLIYPYHKDDHGYGVAGYHNKLWRASRLMCVFVHGEPPTPDHEAAHSCGNGHLACTHPKHVFWKTPRENRLESNEHGTGNQPAPRRLTLDQVTQIKASEKSYFALAEEYGVHRDTIGKIKRGETWAEPRSRLTTEQIAKIKELHDQGERTADIARAVGAKYNWVRTMRLRQTFRGL